MKGGERMGWEGRGRGGEGRGEVVSQLKCDIEWKFLVKCNLKVRGVGHVYWGARVSGGGVAQFSAMCL